MAIVEDRFAAALPDLVITAKHLAFLDNLFASYPPERMNPWMVATASRGQTTCTFYARRVDGIYEVLHIEANEQNFDTLVRNI